MLCAVAFLPPADIIQGFEELVNKIRNIYNDKVNEFLDYLKDNFIGRFRRNATCRPPSFALDLCNVFNRTDDHLPRTNTSIEGWHRLLPSSVLKVFKYFA